VAVGTPARTLEPERHTVQFYRDDEDLVSLASAFLAAGLGAGEACVVVATPTHRAAFDLAIAQLGIDLASLVADGGYITLDADEVLSSVSLDGHPDPVRFAQRIEALIDRASARGRPVRVYGEMVAILWDRGDLRGAIDLEALWNDLGARRTFSLYCAYPLTAIANALDLTATKSVCDHHSSIVTPTNYPLLRELPEFPGGEAECSNFFVPVPQASKAVRRFVIDTLTSWHRDDLVDNASLVVSELASNAVVHASSPFRVSLQQCGSVVRLAVHDASEAPPNRRHDSTDVPGGWGMGIVSALSRRWGCERVADGKIVWAELAGGTLASGTS
jgi:KaiC/GvpD/RAD55 family RecA-like ATPase